MAAREEQRQQWAEHKETMAAEKRQLNEETATNNRIQELQATSMLEAQKVLATHFEFALNPV